MNLPWHVLLTEPNRESTAQRHLKLLGCESYLPVFAKAYKRHVSGGRYWQVFRRPLFPGYLFVQRCEDLFSLVRIAAGIRRRSCPFLGYEGVPHEVELAKIAEIRELERVMNLKRSKRMKFQIGDKVLVRDGAFTGLKAEVYRLTDSERVTLLLELLGQKTKIAIGVDQIDAMAA